MVKDLTYLIFITDLKLRFRNCKEIDRQGVESVSLHLQGLQFLNSLSCSFNGCQKIDRKTITELFQNFKNCSVYFNKHEVYKT